MDLLLLQYFNLMKFGDVMQELNQTKLNQSNEILLVIWWDYETKFPFWIEQIFSQIKNLGGSKRRKEKKYQNNQQQKHKLIWRRILHDEMHVDEMHEQKLV